MKEKRRIQIDLSGEILKDIDRLKESGGTTTANVFRNALKLYKIAKETENKGGRLVVEEKGGARKQIILP